MFGVLLHYSFPPFECPWGKRNNPNHQIYLFLVIAAKVINLGAGPFQYPEEAGLALGKILRFCFYIVPRYLIIIPPPPSHNPKTKKYYNI